jgi:DNA-binding FadR family transcriptional regulator
LRSVLRVVELGRAAEAETAASAALRATPPQLRAIDQTMRSIADAEAAGRDGVVAAWALDADRG